MVSIRRSRVSSGWHVRDAACTQLVSTTDDDDHEQCLWLVVGEAAQLVASVPADEEACCLQLMDEELCSAPHAEILEAYRTEPGGPWARVIPHDVGRLAALVEKAALVGHCNIDGRDSVPSRFLRVDGNPNVVCAGGRLRSTGELWFCRPLLQPVLQRRPPPLAPRAAIDTLKRMKTMDGRRVEAAPPLRALEQSLTDDVVAQLVDRGYAVVDNALPAGTCRKLKAEMQALEANGQMWNSKSYGSDDDGAPHPHINETQLDYKEVRKFAPTFARMEYDPSLVERMRGVPGLENLGSQHVRIQINTGHGGCYTMHTDSGTGPMGPGQTLCLTALIYLNEDWQPGDGGELRVFPYPHPAEVIAPRMGRLVLFEPRMVHDVLPNYKKRFCFTLWCAQKYVNGGSGPVASAQIDHETLHKAELSPSLADGAHICAAWRRKKKHFIAYSEATKPLALISGPPAARGLLSMPDWPLPPALRALFLPEMRMMLVRIVHREDELAQVRQSHAGTSRADEMLSGIARYHDLILAENPKWLLDLLHMLPAAHGDGLVGGAETPVRPAELRAAIHRLTPWWIA